MPTPYGCPYKQECTEEVNRDAFFSFCQSETNKYIYCESYKRFEQPVKLPREWDKW